MQPLHIFLQALPVNPDYNLLEELGPFNFRIFLQVSYAAGGTGALH